MVEIYLQLLLTSSMDAPNTFPALFLPIFPPNLATFYPLKVPENSKGDLERDCSQFPDWLDGLAAARKAESTPLHIPMMLEAKFCHFSQTLILLCCDNSLAKRLQTSCVNAAGKLRQMLYETAGTKFTKPGQSHLADSYSVRSLDALFDTLID